MVITASVLLKAPLFFSSWPVAWIAASDDLKRRPSCSRAPGPQSPFLGRALELRLRRPDAASSWADSTWERRSRQLPHRTPSRCAPGTPPIFAGKSPTTSARSRRMPERPARRRDQDVSTSAARGVTAPMPVTTIRRVACVNGPRFGIGNAGITASCSRGMSTCHERGACLRRPRSCPLR